MARRAKSRGRAVPTYRFHKRSGQAVVTINGKDIYLDKYDTGGSLNESPRADIHAAESEIRQIEHLLELADKGRTDELAKKLRFLQGGQLSQAVVLGEAT